MVNEPVGRYAIEAPDGRRVYSDDREQVDELAAANRRVGCAVVVVDTEKATEE